MTVALDISLKIGEALEQITQANGYQTDIGRALYHGRLKLDLEDVPCCVLVEGPDEVASEGGSYNVTAAIKPQPVQMRQTYYAEGHAACDPDNPNLAAHAMIADLKKAIFSGDRTFGGKVRKIGYKGRLINRREDGLKVVSASIAFTVEFVEDLANP